MEIKSFAIVLAVVLAWFIGKASISRVVKRIGTEKNITPGRIQYVRATLIMVWTLLALILIGVNVGIGYHDLGLFFGSALAILGIAFFAQWSILSNVTASIIVFFFFPYRVGDHVKIIDGENTVEGSIKEITLFHVILSDENGLITTYPNALVFQKAVQIKQKEKHRLKQKQKPKKAEVENPLVESEL